MNCIKPAFSDFNSIEFSKSCKAKFSTYCVPKGLHRKRQQRTEPCSHCCSSIVSCIIACLLVWPPLSYKLKSYCLENFQLRAKWKGYSLFNAIWRNRGKKVSFLESLPPTRLFPAEKVLERSFKFSSSTSAAGSFCLSCITSLEVIEATFGTRCLLGWYIGLKTVSDSELNKEAFYRQLFSAPTGFLNKPGWRNGGI